MSGYDPHRIDDKPCICDHVDQCRDPDGCPHAVIHDYGRCCHSEGFSNHMSRKWCGGWCMPASNLVVAVIDERPA